MLFDSKMPAAPSGLNAAGTVPNGCAARKASVLCSVPPKPVRAARAVAPPDSPSASGRASKSHSQPASSRGVAPRISSSTPHSRAAIVALASRGFGRYEKTRRRTRRAHRPSKRASRRSTNERMPSAASALGMTRSRTVGIAATAAASPAAM